MASVQGDSIDKLYKYYDILSDAKDKITEVNINIIYVNISCIYGLLRSFISISFCVFSNILTIIEKYLSRHRHFSIYV